MIKKIISAFAILGIVLGTIGTPLVANAAQFTGVKDTLSTVATSATATHVITNTLVGGDTFAAGETLTYDFTDADFTLNAIGNWQTSDFSFNDGSARTIIAVSTSSGVAPTCTAGTSNVAVTINTTTNNFVVTACSTYTASSANANVTFTINGTTATGTGTMTNKTSDVDNSVYTIAESNGDSATGAVVAETNGVVNVTATVSPTLTFSNSQSAVDFGPLTSGAARYATGGAASGGNSSATTNAHLLTVGTNATSGYTVTYNSAATLTSGANTIAAATITTAGGTPGSAQFALGAVSSSGTPTINGTYDASTSKYSFAPGSPVTLFNATAPASSDAVNVRYIANIPASQPAGSYSTSITYVATGNF
jgi:hypothetical protein